MKQAVFINCVLAAAFALSTATGLAQVVPANDATPEVPTGTSLATQSNPMTLELDARPASRGLMYSHMTIPAKPGDFVIVYPKWIPGEHGPTGPLNDLTQLKVSAGGHTLQWRRDKVDMYAFHVDVPQGVSRINVDFTVVLNAPGDVMSTKNLAIVNWNRDLLYQSNVNSHQYYVKPTLLLPRRWSFGSAMPGAHQVGDRVTFSTTPLNMVIDSPLDMGRFYKHVVLWSNGKTFQMLDAFADRPEDLDFSSKELAEYKRMTPQALALYGSRHWNVYHSLLALSDAVGFQGIEHHQSSDDRAPDDFMVKPSEQLAAGDLLTHEFSHSWNGKYRRPYDLTPLNFQIAERTDLLWVYEGMNQYLGDLLSFRMGIRQPKQYPEYLATVYASMDTEPGRYTTPIIDTTTAAPYLYQARGSYSSLRRTAGDFYTEGELIWLDADTIIRQKTGGKKSLDTFLHLFTAPSLTGPVTKTYTRADVEHLLNEVVPYNWHAFFQRHVYEVSVHPPTAELARAGWRFVYTDKPNTFMAAEASLRHGIDDWYSMGINIGADGTVYDVRQDSPAWKAGLAPGVKLVAINDRAFSPEVLTNALKDAQHSNAAIRFLGVQTGYFSTYNVDYHGGEKYPHLVRIPGKPDMLAKIMAPH